MSSTTANSKQMTMIAGDCVIVIPTLAARFDGILTSPPYNMKKNPRHRAQGHGDVKLYRTSPFDDALDPPQYVANMIKLFRVLESCIVERGVILWNMGVSTKDAMLPIQLINAVNNETAWTLGDTLYWKKGTAMPFQTSPNKCSPLVEPVYVFCRRQHVADFRANKPLGARNERTGQQFYKPVSNWFEAPNGRSTELNKATFSRKMASELL